MSLLSPLSAVHVYLRLHLVAEYQPKPASDLLWQLDKRHGPQHNNCRSTELSWLHLGTADDTVCGDQCCSKYATCYNSDGQNGVDSCCDPGGERLLLVIERPIACKKGG